MKFNFKNLKTLDILTILASVGAVSLIAKSLFFGNKGFKKFDPKGKTFAFMGDSYTSWAKYGWQSIMSQLYGIKEVNLAKGGMQTSWMVSKTKDYLANNKPDYYVILGGANDSYSPQKIETALGNIQKMIDMANEKGVKPIVVIGYNARKVQVGNTKQKPTREQLSRGVTQQTLWGMGEKYYQMQLRMKDLKNAIIVPIWEEATKDDVSDGLHMTANAHKRFGEYVGNYLFKKD